MNCVLLFLLILIQSTLEAHDFSSENVGLKQILDNSGCLCGIERVSNRIINGVPVEKGRYPLFAQLPICGGGLISDRHIMTSAHCIKEMLRLGLEFSYGKHPFNNPIVTSYDHNWGNQLIMAY